MPGLPPEGPRLPPLPFFTFFGVCFIFSVHFLIACIMGCEVVVRGNVQVNTAEADFKSCSKQNKLLLTQY